jgi:cysteine desulfuration protein SufE
MSLKEREQAIINDFNFFESWDQKYEYIINLGNELNDSGPRLKSEKNLIQGCQSRVWLTSYLKNEKIFFTGDSDALITKGLVALLLKIFSNARPEEVAIFELSLVNSVGLNKHLSMNRANGLGKMIEKIKTISLNYLK